MEELTLIEARLQQWAVPSDVRDMLRRAVATVTGEGTSLVGQVGEEEVSLAVRGQPAALYLSPSRVSAALMPTDADRAHRGDSAIGLDKESDTNWIVHCRYGRLDQSRLNSMAMLMTKALRRYAPAPPRPAATRAPRKRAASPAKPASPRSGAAREEERRLVAGAAIPRCPVPGCNLPMVGGSCGFHD